MKNLALNEQDHTLSSEHEQGAGKNAFIRKLETLVTLSEADRQAVAEAIANRHTIQAGMDLMSVGRAPAGAILLLEGFACRYRLGFNGERQITDYLLPGDLGVVEASGGGKLETIGAMVESKVARFSSAGFSKLIEAPTIAGAFRTISAVGEATLRQWLMNIGRRSAEERLAHLFCELSHRWQAIDGVSSDNSFHLPLTQFDLGDTMGLSYVHVNRTLQSLRHKNLITLRNRTLTILDQPRLKSLARFDPSYLEARTAAGEHD